MNLPQLRKEIDDIDRELVSLFCKRMALSKEVAAFKFENQLPISLPSREAEILNRVIEMSSPGLEADSCELYMKIFELSKRYQEHYMKQKESAER